MLPKAVDFTSFSPDLFKVCDKPMKNRDEG